MADEINGRKVFSLLDVNRSIQKTLRNRYGSAFWVKAEMMKLNHYPHSGHCYPDLVEKRKGKIVAEMRANLWRSDFRRINALFKKTLKEPLKDGIKVLFLTNINFDPKYGLSLQILDIDPAFTLGDMEQERQQTISQLQEEKLFHKNKSLSLPLLPKRIAIISVETSKGLADFRKIIDHNTFGYNYFYFLFPSLLQGDNAVGSIIRALNRIRRVMKHFDIVAIIRGGGGDIGLSCYNDYELCKTIANFPLPVISGIGHATNETVTELVAHSNCITPTKTAEWLLQHFHDVAQPLKKGEEIIAHHSKLILKEKRSLFENQVQNFKSETQNKITFYHHQLTHLQKDLKLQTDVRMKEQRQILTQVKERLNREVNLFEQRESEQLFSLQKQVKLLDPINILKRGYHLLYQDGDIIKYIDEVKRDVELETVMRDGVIKSKIVNIEKKQTNE